MEGIGGIGIEMQIAQIKALSPDPRHATKLLSALGTNWHTAVYILGLMHICRKDINTYHLGSILNACQKASQWLRAAYLLWNQQFLSRETVTSTVCCSSVISSCGNAGQWKKAVSVLALMRQSICEPNLVSLNSAASSCERHGLWRDACRFFYLPKQVGLERKLEGYRLQEDDSSLASRYEGIQVDTISFNALISSCEKAGEWQRAFSILQVMSTFAISCSLISFSAAVSACEKADQWNWALQVFRERKCKRFGRFHLHFCNGLVSACGKGGKWNLVNIIFWKEMALMSIEPDTVTFNAALYSFDHLQWQKAVSILRQMTFVEVEKNDITFNAACASARYSWLAVVRLLSDMKLAELRDDALTQSALVSSLGAQGEAERLAAVLKQVARVWVERVRPS